MTFQYKADFSAIEWEHPIKGVRHKYFDRDNIRLRLVEYSKDMPPHWCEQGHYGYVLEGRMEVEYDNGSVTYDLGDGIFIPDGPQHKHRAKILSEKALVFFLEQIHKVP